MDFQWRSVPERRTYSTEHRAAAVRDTTFTALCAHTRATRDTSWTGSQLLRVSPVGPGLPPFQRAKVGGWEWKRTPLLLSSHFNSRTFSYRSYIFSEHALSLWQKKGKIKVRMKKVTWKFFVHFIKKKVIFFAALNDSIGLTCVLTYRDQTYKKKKKAVECDRRAGHLTVFCTSCPVNRHSQNSCSFQIERKGAFRNKIPHFRVLFWSHLPAGKHSETYSGDEVISNDVLFQ